MSTPNPRFFNYPTPRETNVPWEEPPALNNPPISGLLFHYAAIICETIKVVPQFLYKSNGFGSLDKIPALHQFEARYDPTVIPVTSDTEKELGAFDPTAVENLRRPVSSGNGGEFRFLSVADFFDGYSNGRFTPTDVVNALLPLIRRDIANPTTHATAFISTRVDLVLEAAARSTIRWQQGKQFGVLDGVPFAVKDEVDVKGYLTTNGSKRDFSARGDVTSWDVRQWEDTGAILVGKTNLHEAGLDTCCNNPVYGTPRNPYNSSYYCGGSSGGSAYAVAAGLVPFALGVDFGGSIRIPAAHCGVFGLKTTSGRISKLPTVTANNTLSVNGPICADMATLEIAYRVQATPDPSHIHSSRFPIPRPLPPSSSASRPKLIGIYQEWWNRSSPEVLEICNQALQYLTTKLNYTIIPITIPHVSAGQKAHALTTLAESSTAITDTSDLTAETKTLLSIGRQTPSSDFLLAQKMRNLQMSHLAYLFQTHPGLIVLTPVTPEAGWAIKNDPSDLWYGCSDGDASVRSMEYVWLANSVGCPCLAGPVGYVEPKKGGKGQKVPVGMMGMGEWASEEDLISFGWDLEGYLVGGVEGGRRRPRAWVDLLGVVEGGREKE